MGTNLISKRWMYLLLLLSISACNDMQKNTRPELTGIWTNISLTPLTRPQGIDHLVLTDEEARHIAEGSVVVGFAVESIKGDTFTNPVEGAPQEGSADFGVRAYNSFWVDPGNALALVKGKYRSSYIIDPANGQIPRRPINANGSSGSSRYVTGVGGNSDPEVLPLSERCLIGFGNTGGPGMLSVLYNNTYQFVQTDDHVMILVEMVHDARIIPTFASAEEARVHHSPDAIKPWLGDSVGWYEDGALLVETININPQQASRSTIAISDEGRLIERFERYSDSEIIYRFTVEDSSLYTQPWTAELSFHTTEGPVYEYACHEGNYAMEGILAGARLQEREPSVKDGNRF